MRKAKPKQLKPAMSYFGGKTDLAQKIVAMMPEHETYVEPFCGAAAVFLAKPRSKVEVISDLNKGLIHYYKVLQNEKTWQEFILRVNLTPHSREECVQAPITWEEQEDSIERARQWFVAQSQGFSGTWSSGWSFSSTSFRAGMSLRTKQWLNQISRLPAIHERLRGTVILRSDFEKVIKKYDSPTTVFYLDPPYVHESELGGRTVGEYVHTMTDEEHERMLKLLLKVKGGVILSGYKCPLYDTMLKKWKRVDRRATSYTAPSSRLGLPPNAVGEGFQTGQRTRTECLWLNSSLERMWK